LLENPLKNHIFSGLAVSDVQCSPSWRHWPVYIVHPTMMRCPCIRACSLLTVLRYIIQTMVLHAWVFCRMLANT